jgi:hypothetical protein
MGVVIGLILIAGGAILTWAVTGTLSGLNVTAVGVILLVIGLLVVILDFIWWRSWEMGPWARAAYSSGPPPPGYAGRPRGRRRRVVVDEETTGGPPPPP